ncbi:LOW QUALITY PROTEIN: oral cancer-overexpressed protein 1 [Carlito syrichta]|uniref:LOW QUALITY PROTEIN: oral cancer-overexpressed protein 1 n=1 Tax=Carlito syrichta TaxID=1868482 RepID=A0A3Q0DS55_CARSF|nr:LOW QUALITY PROTEIN: oral cancer-overexpressed protein 1 [Carlito syrichta]
MHDGSKLAAAGGVGTTLSLVKESGLREAQFHGEGYQEGFEEGSSLGMIEGRRYGTVHGARVASEIGCYQGFALAWKCLLHGASEKDRRVRVLESLLGMIQRFPYDDPTYDKLQEDLDRIRGKFKQDRSACHRQDQSRHQDLPPSPWGTPGCPPLPPAVWKSDQPLPRCAARKTQSQTARRPAGRRPSQTCVSQDRLRGAPWTCHQPWALGTHNLRDTRPSPRPPGRSVPQGPAWKGGGQRCPGGAWVDPAGGGRTGPSHTRVALRRV